MKKHAYRAKNINELSVESMRAKLSGERIIVAIDVAKRNFVVGFAGSDGEVVEHAKFTHPIQTRQFLELLGRVRGQAVVEVLMEPTGTYGDAMRGQLAAQGFATFAVSPKRCHDAAEIFDGVPSLHDAKATMILARLHVQGLSKPWPMEDEARRTLRAAIARRELYAAPLEADQGRLEALLSRHWPEFFEHLDPRSRKTPLALLAEFPGPQEVSGAPDAAAKRMATFSRGRLSGDTIGKVVLSAKSTLGVPMHEQERKLLRELAHQMLELWRQVDRTDDEIAELARSQPATSALAPTVGLVTSAVLVAMLGPASSYPSAGAYVKAMGLNLKEHSSGTSKKPGTGLHLTKRGPGLVRKYLFLAALRLIQTDPLCRAWYETRQAHRRGEKLKAVIALMRKLARALWHVGRGQPFDAAKLFDTRRLAVQEPARVVNG